MMQRRAAFEVKTNKRVGNWSGVGSGKTVSAILSSRVVDARHTLVIAANATLAGWRREIRNAYPGFSSKYTMINYEKFQQPDRGPLVQRLVESDVDFVVLDEVSGLEPFLAGRVDILVGSKPVGTGLDGLQRVSNN